MALHPIYRVEELRAIEAAASDSPLMERAGRAAAGVARDLLTDRLPRVLVLSGPGNNGGDAMVVARWLRAWFYDVTVAFCGDASRLPSDAQGAYRSWTDAGGAVADALPERVDWGLVVDGLFGIGLRRAIEGVPAQWIERVNASDVPILARDIPSGMNADTG